MEIEGKVAIVTGAASGIGRAMAERFTALGAEQVVVADVTEDVLQEVAEVIGADAVVTDVSDENAVKTLVDMTEDRYGQIDILCSNAGIMVKGGPEVANEDWDRIWQINVMAHVYAARAALPGMIQRGEGYILNTASAAGLLTQVGSAPYAVTKHAAIGFAEWLAVTYGDRGLKVSVLCPQAVRTGMSAQGSGAEGVASLDGQMEPEELCDYVVEAIYNENFLVLPHPEVLTYIQRKTSDYDRWLRGMRRLQAQFGDSDWPA